MIVTPKMWELKQRIGFLQGILDLDPGDYMARFEMDELTIAYAKLDKRERLGIRVIPGGRQPSTSQTANGRQVS